MGFAISRKGLVAAFAVAIVVSAYGVGATPAFAAYDAHVKNGTLKVTGDGAGDKIALAAEGGTNNLVLDVGEDGTVDFRFDMSTFTSVQVLGGGGDDEIRLLNGSGVFATEIITINGGPGNDTLIGANGNDILIGGTGNDFADGNIGADQVSLGGGNDTAQWDPGDGSDVVDGGGGIDRLAFNGSNIGEHIDVTATGSRVRLSRDVALITMDLGDIETIGMRLLGGTDVLTVGDMTGTDVKAVDADLTGFDGLGDATADTVVANGTNGNDKVSLTNAGGGLVVDGLAADTRVTGDETIDAVTVNTLAGNDTLTADVGDVAQAAVNFDGGDNADVLHYDGSAGPDQIGIARNGVAAAVFAPGSVLVNDLATSEDVVVAGLGGDDMIVGQNGVATIARMTLDGGTGNDTVRGTDAPDMLIGGPGNDLVDGNIGADTALLGGGDDHFQWDPGDGSDLVEGQSGNDQIDFNGSNIGEHIDLSANGGRLRLTRDVALITMDAASMEAVNIRALGGIDQIGISDLTGTGVRNVGVNLTGFDGLGDATADTVVVNGTNLVDRVHVLASGAQVLVDGLTPDVAIVGSEPALDTLLVQTLAGDDQVTVDPGVPGLINPVVDLGADG